MLIRTATRDDLDQIFAIYDREVLRGTATFDTEPKTPAQREEWLAQHASARHPVIVAVGELREHASDGGSDLTPGAQAVLGWASLSAWSTRCAYARAAENSVYVHHAARGRGVGRALLTDLLRRGREAGLGVVLARVVEGNPASVALHRACGFRTVGVMKRVGEKFGMILDVRLMQVHIDGFQDDPATAEE
jgi:phosphinothricin acetyltransferase